MSGSSRGRGAVKFVFWAAVAAALIVTVARSYTSGQMAAWFYHTAAVEGYAVNADAFMDATKDAPAVLQVGGISLALSERPAPTIDQEIYRHLGLEPRTAKIVQVKSPGGFRAVYGPFAAGIFEIDTPGPTDSELTRLPFRKIRRPLWPFDPELSAPW